MRRAYSTGGLWPWAPERVGRSDALGLTTDGCLKRQQRLRGVLSKHGLAGAIVTNPRYVHYLTGHWGREVFATAVWISTEGPVVLATAYPPDHSVVAEAHVTFPAAHLATLVDDQAAEAIRTLMPFIDGHARLGSDTSIWPHLIPNAEVRDISDDFLAMRRTKDDDEIALLRGAVSGCEAAFAASRRLLRPGLSEVELFARIQAAAVERIGEPIGEFGNDFQAGTGGGGLPRNRAVRAGELLPLDLSVVVRGYCSDMCRTLCVGGDPSPAQIEAHRLVLDALAYVERTVRPGVSCRILYDDVFRMIDGRNGWRFTHHLGHGIGIAPHEAPRLNPHWDDTFRLGDVFTAEPGLYGDDLLGGVRIEQEYLVTEVGLERLSNDSVAL